MQLVREESTPGGALLEGTILKQPSDAETAGAHENLGQHMLVRRQDADKARQKPASLARWNNGAASRFLFAKMHHKIRHDSGDYETPRWVHRGLMPVMIGFVSVGFLISCVIIVLVLRGQPVDVPQAPANSETGGSGGESSALTAEKDVHHSPEGLDEDLYGMGIAALIRDSQRFAQNSELFHLRFSRLMIALLVLLFTMTLQIFLLFEMKVLVTSVSTKEAREAYDEYEVYMYGNNPANMTVTANGYHRGKPENFKIERFDTLPDDLKEDVCQISLSQPTFFMAILICWTLVCAAEMRRSLELAVSLAWSTPTIASMADATVETPESGDEAVLVTGLTRCCKLIAVIFILLPRLAVSTVLLWLGCRWLTGTMGFSDVLQNAVALEFILLLKNVLYDTMAPHHNKMETRNTLILPNSDEEKPSLSVFLGAFVWGVLALAWVAVYIEFGQQVLPDYQWDIHDACADYLIAAATDTANGTNASVF